MSKVKVRHCNEPGCAECLKILHFKIVRAAENWANQWENPEYGTPPHKRLMNAVKRLHQFQGKEVEFD